MMENVEVIRDKEIRSCISLLLGLIIKKYHQHTSNYNICMRTVSVGACIAVSVKMVQLLQNNEHLVNVLSQIIKQMTTEYNIHSFVTDIVK